MMETFGLLNLSNLISRLAVEPPGILTGEGIPCAISIIIWELYYVCTLNKFEMMLTFCSIKE